jgi:hypothetical protein
VNPRGLDLGGKKERQYFGKRHPRIADANEDFPGGANLAGNENATRSALLGREEMAGRFGESEIPGPRPFRGSQPGEERRAITFDLALESFGDFGGGVGNGNKGGVGYKMPGPTRVNCVVDLFKRRARVAAWRDRAPPCVANPRPTL